MSVPGLRFDALIFDFDGVLLESEYAGNAQIADYLTRIGHPTTAEESMARFMGLAGADFIAAVESHIGRPLPADFHEARAAEGGASEFGMVRDFYSPTTARSKRNAGRPV